MNTKGAVDSLKGFSDKYEAEFIENTNGGFLTINNNYAKGNAKAFKILPGLEVITFNITTNDTVYLETNFGKKNCLHFIFCIEGSLEYRSTEGNKKTEIHRLQNVIISSNKENSCKITIPKKTKAKFSLITIVGIKNLSAEIKRHVQLSRQLSYVMEKIDTESEYAYFGKISTEATTFVETLIDTNLVGLSNRLINEASVYKTLAFQYTDHAKDIGDAENKNPLTKSDTNKVIKLSEHISNNLTENLSLESLSKMSGLNQKKIQKGFHFFFDETVNKFITNLRILKAKELLETTDLSISEIVYQIGLNSRSYFSKIFYQKYGLIPKDYKKNHHLSNPTFQLSYWSKATQGLGKLDLENILQSSKKNNEKLNITGCLIYHSNKFFQFLEGPKNEVLELVETIKKDNRNTDLQIIFKGVFSGRIFGKWSMGLVQGDFQLAETEQGFETVPTDFLALTDVKNPVANKYMWEKARNYLIVKQEQD